MSSKTEAEARVQRGIEFLEEKVGSGWKSLVDVEKLRLDIPHCCILGQVFSAQADGAAGSTSGYDYAVSSYFEGGDDIDGDEVAADNGFDSVPGVVTYTDLEAAWKRVLTDPVDGGGQ